MIFSGPLDNPPGPSRHHEARQHDDPDERVAELCASPQRRRPIPRIHIAYRDEVSWTKKRREPAQAGPLRRHIDTAIDLYQRRLIGLASHPMRPSEPIIT